LVCLVAIIKDRVGFLTYVCEVFLIRSNEDIAQHPLTQGAGH
jgi:hypothetical protein